MKDGFISVAAGTPKIRVADCRYNAEQIFTLMREADKQGGAVPHRLHLRRPVSAGHPAPGCRGGPPDDPGGHPESGHRDGPGAACLG